MRFSLCFYSGGKNYTAASPAPESAAFPVDIPRRVGCRPWSIVRYRDKGISSTTASHDPHLILTALTPTRRFRLGLLLSVTLAAGIFIFDLVTPRGVNGDLLFVGLVLVALFLRQPVAAIVLAQE